MRWKKEDERKEEREGKSGGIARDGENEVSCLKASNGQRFPCPALPFLVFLGGSGAAALNEDEEDDRNM